MRYSVVIKLAMAAAVSVGSADTVHAAIISGTYVITGSNFTSPVPPPFATITETFTISFDNTKTVSQQTTGISLNGSTITPSSALGFSYIAGADLLTVGGIADSVGTADPASTDFALTIRNVSQSNFSISALSYTVGTNATFTALTRTAAPVPEPVSLALLGTAVTMIVYGRSRETNR